MRGSISGKLMPHSSQAKCSENSMSFTIAMPFPNRKAVSRESTSRGLSISSETTSLSTTTSILCFFFMAISISKASATLYTIPSIRTRTKPARCTSSNKPLCSPFLPLTTGPKIAISSSSESFMTCSAIWLTDWRFTSLPHFGQ